MRIILHLLTLLLISNFAFAQTENDPFISTHKVGGYDNKVEFKMDNLPELLPIPGAVEKPEIKYLWLFGDGQYSFDDNPTHVYDKIQAEAFDVECFLTYTYTDDEQDPEKKKRRRKKSKVAVNSFGNRTQSTAIASSFTRRNKNSSDKNAVYLQTNRSPKAGEEMVAILSYRNTSPQAISGKLNLFYNEYKSCPDCFTLPETPKSYNDEIYYSSDIGMIDLFANAVASSDSKVVFTSNTSDNLGAYSPFRDEYASQETWEITNLESGQEHHVFIILKTDDLKTDTSLTTPVLGRFENLNGQIIDDFEMELQLVSSHDPNNVLAANYNGRMERKFDMPWQKRDQILYRINFQNDGDGAASEIKIVLNIPDALDTSSVEIKEVGIGKNNKILDGDALFHHVVYEDSIVFFLQHINLGGTGESGIKKADSRGYISFNIKAKPRKVRKIVSQANIYFDTNEPVRTKKSRIRLKRSSRFTLEIGVQQPQAFGDWVTPSPDLSLDNKFIGIGTSALIPKKRLSLDASIRYSVERYDFAEASAEFSYKFKHLTFNLTPQIDVLPFLRIGIGAEGGVLLSGENNGFQEFNVFDQTQQDDRYGPLRYGGVLQVLIGATKKQGFALGASYNRYHDIIPVVFPFITEIDSRWHNVFRFYLRYKI
jgi:hypothetical protein